MRFAITKKLNSLSLFLLAFLLVSFSWQPIPLFNPEKVAATTQTFGTSGSWVAPAGVTSVLVEAWGGGGAGGGRTTNGQSGGGGGGAFASATVAVTPGQTYSYTVGAAAVGGTANGANGNFSQWLTGADVRAAGGSGGLGTTTGGLGGTAAASVGTVIYKGGDGGSATALVSGGGGGGAGTTGDGGNATAGTAGTGTSVGGGNGGPGISAANAAGTVGSAAGGGGSGARRSNSQNRLGGNGAAGQIRLTYNAAPVFSVNTTDSPDPVNYGSNVTFTATATDTEHQWKLVVCKTNSVTPGANPACASGETVCVSANATASGASNSCVWTSNQTTNLAWYSFACDDTATMPTCSTADTNNSPLTINVIISVAVTSDGIINFGTLNSGQSRSTLELGDTQTARNDTNIAEDFNIKTSAPAGWSVSASPGSDAFVHEFSTNGGSNWTKFSAAESYQTLVSNILPNATQNFDLRITSPNPSTSGGQKSVDITIQAVQH